MYNWYHSFITTVIQHIYGHKLQYTLYIALPLCSPFLLTWHPPAVTGMVHLSPRLLVNCPLCPPLLPRTPPFLILHPLWVFPGPNVLLIRTHPNPFPSVRHTNGFADPEYLNTKKANLAQCSLSTKKKLKILRT
jgi:hypothetical protein